MRPYENLRANAPGKKGGRCVSCCVSARIVFEARVVAVAERLHATTSVATGCRAEVCKNVRCIVDWANPKLEARARVLLKGATFTCGALISSVTSCNTRCGKSARAQGATHYASSNAIRRNRGALRVTVERQHVVTSPALARDEDRAPPNNRACTVNRRGRQRPHAGAKTAKFCAERERRQPPPADPAGPEIGA